MQPQWHEAQCELKNYPQATEDILVWLSRSKLLFLQQFLYQCPDWFQGCSGKAVQSSGTLLMGQRHTSTALLLALLYFVHFISLGDWRTSEL